MVAAAAAEVPLDCVAHAKAREIKSAFEAKQDKNISPSLFSLALLLSNAHTYKAAKKDLLPKRRRDLRETVKTGSQCATLQSDNTSSFGREKVVRVVRVRVACGACVA